MQFTLFTLTIAAAANARSMRSAVDYATDVPAYTEAPLSYENAVDLVDAATAYTDAPCDDEDSISGYDETIVDAEYEETDAPAMDYGQDIADAVPAYTDAPGYVASMEAPFPYDKVAAAEVDYTTEAPCAGDATVAPTEYPAVATVEEIYESEQAHQTYLQSSASKPAAAVMAMISMVLPVVMYL